MESFFGLTMRGIIKNENNEILILKRHPSSKTDPEKWELPGGKVDPGESFDHAILREISEECNLDVEIEEFFEAVQVDYSHKKTVQMVMKLNINSGEFKLSDEHVDWMWADLDRIHDLELSSSFEKVLEKKNWKL
ncbi:NUDIX domain-containing protein [Methanobrevibacter oralis]|uniref:8-oxo-dGTP diphosphatase n=1 Tax=Methanobrevibacter oralis TaxID=66851 RepID=A0A166AM21_METOA|nr:NUDIX domain-containing protein [Methanobrevibacter oralis]KZX12214.1 8-oxo-dGTP diphosphatase [Methanobrevibacter oralis]